MSGVRLSSWLVTVLLLLGFVAVPSIASAQEANVEPNVGPSGTEFAFFATGFDENEQVGVWVNNPDGSVSEIIDDDGDVFVIFANDEGRADWFITFTGPDGFYGMVARGVNSGYEIVIPFQLSSGADAPVPQPPSPDVLDANVEPNAGPAGTEFAFFAEGFEPGEQVGVWINAPDGSILSVFDENGDVLSLFANEDGRVDWSVTSPSEAPPGFYSMVATGLDSGNEVAIPFEILP